MSSFFTLPSSQKKRKRTGAPERSISQKRANTTRKVARDESISGSDDSDNEGDGSPASNTPHGGRDVTGSSDDDDEDFEGEDPATKRIRLAEQYLANTQKEVLEDLGFDAADVDQENLRRRMGDRLKEDTAESKGRLYRWIADDVDWSHARQQLARIDGKSVTGVAVHGRYVYTSGKDMSLSKWELPWSDDQPSPRKSARRTASKPKRVAYTRGNSHKKGDRDFQHHHGPILCIAVSPDGKFLASGGADNKLIAWDASTLQPLKVFYQHRDSVTGLAFRRGSNQLFSASKDRTVKIWSLDELAYVDTLFGHQDEVVDVSALTQEKCVTVGARDRTARLWKVVEESQLVFRGGGAPGKSKDRKAKERLDDGTVGMQDNQQYNEGSMDRVACVDDETFITGSDNGSLSLWSIHKKKPVFTYALAHGLQPPPSLQSMSAETYPDETKIYREPTARWITALSAIPFSNVFVSGSWDGTIRVWRITQDRRQIEAVATLGSADGERHKLFEDDGADAAPTADTAADIVSPMPAGRIHGVVNDLSIIELGDRAKDGFLIAGALSKELRLGRWTEMKGAKNSLVVYTIPRKAVGGGGDATDLDGAEQLDGDE